MKKRALSMLLSILVLLLLSAAAFAEADQEEVSAAAMENSIEFTSFSADWDHITYTVSYSITNGLAQQGYDIGIEYSTAPTFRSGNQAYTYIDSSGIYNFTEAGDNLTYSTTRTSVSFVPGITYYIRPVLVGSNQGWNNPLAFGNYRTYAAMGDSGFSTVSTLRQDVYAQGWLRAKFTAPNSGLYALVDDGTFDFVSYACKTVNNGVEVIREASSVNRQQNGNGQSLAVFFRADENETVYLFGCPRTGSGSVQVVPAEAPSENSIEVGEAYDPINISASFDFTVSTTVQTANNGYRIGIEYGEGTNPENWEGRADFGPPRTDLMIQRTIRGRNDGIFVPGMDVYYRAVLLDGQTREVLARGSNIWHLVTPNNTDGLQELSLNTETVGRNSGIQGLVPYYFTASATGMYAFQGDNWSSFVLRDRIARVRVAGSGQSTYLFGEYLRQGETVYVGGYYNNNLNNLNECSVLVTEGLTTFPQLTQVAPLGLNGQTPTWFRAPWAGLYRFAIDESSPANLMMVNEDGSWQNMGKEFLVGLESNQVLWIRSSSGEVSNLSLTVEAAESYITSDLDLNGRGTFHITQNMIIAKGVNLSYWGTELIIDPGVTLTIRGNADGEAVNNAGTLRIEGDSAMFRSGSRMQLSGSGKVEIDGHGYVEFASNSLANNDYLDPLDPQMDIRFSNGGSVTFGYFIPSEQYMWGLLDTLVSSNSNPNIRLDLQFYCGIALTQDLTLPEHVTLHTDSNWGQGAGFMIPAGKTLTIPEGGGFYAFTSAINIEGTLVNNGEIVLGSVRNVDNYPKIINMSLKEGGNYTGNGIVTIETLNNPLSYMSGFTGYKVDEVWRGESRISYRLAKIYDFRNNGQGSYTLANDMTIAASERLHADELIIPSGKTLTIDGYASIDAALVIQEGGALVIGDGGRVELHGYPPRTSVAATSITMGNNAELLISQGHWNQSNIKNGIQVSGENAMIHVENRVTAEHQSGFRDVLNIMAQEDVPAALQGHVRKEFSICFPYTPTEDFTIPAGVEFRVLNSGSSDEAGSLTIPQKVTLTVPANGYLGLNASNLTVYGTIVNDGRIELLTRSGGPEGTMPVFTMAESAGYSGNGEIWVRSFQRDPAMSLVGFKADGLFLLNRDDLGGQYRYINKTAHTISDGMTFSFRTADEGIFEGQYSGGYLMTPGKSGLYAFTVSFEGNPAVHRDQALLGISGTSLEDCAFDTDEPASLAFSAELTAGEKYEMVLANNSSLGALNVQVAVNATTGPIQHFDNRFVLPAATGTIEAEAFAGTAAQEIQLQNAIESIGAKAFADSNSLCLVVIPNANVEIDPSAFKNSSNVRIAAPAEGTVQVFAVTNQIGFLPMPTE